MTNDKTLYFVICEGRDGRYLPERKTCDLNRAATIKDIAAGQVENVVCVIECNAAEFSSRDVTEEILREAGRWDEPEVCSSIDFTRDRNRDYRKQVA